MFPAATRIDHCIFISVIVIILCFIFSDKSESSNPASSSEESSESDASSDDEESNEEEEQIDDADCIWGEVEADVQAFPEYTPEDELLTLPAGHFETPAEVFRLLVTDDIVEMIVTETNRYAPILI